MQNGADPNAVEEDGEIPLFYAAMNGHLETVKFFAEETSANLERTRFKQPPCRPSAY
jgi:ankyrin repeat protein